MWGLAYRQWNVFLFKLDAIRIRIDIPVTVKAVRNIANNGLHDLSLSCWIKLGIGGEDEMEVMWRDHDAPADQTFHLIQLLCRLKVIVFVLLSGVSFTLFLRCVFGARVAVMDITVSEDDAIPMAVLSHLGGGQSERSEWLPQVSQCAGLRALPMRAHWRTVTFFWKIRILYK